MKKYCKGTKIFNICLRHLSLRTKNLRRVDFFRLCDLRDSNRDSELELVKIPCTLFILVASLLAGQKRHFEGVKMKD